MTGLEIYKLLPRTNCQKCAYPTCLAFAMAVAGGHVGAEECPDLSDEACQVLLDATAPPVATVSFGHKGNELSLGGETVLFRHEKRFNTPTVLAVTVEEELGPEGRNKRLWEVASSRFQRVGQEVGVEAAVLHSPSGNATTLAQMTTDLLRTNLAPVLAAPTGDAMEEALEVLAGKATPLLWPTSGDHASCIALASKAACPLIIDAAARTQEGGGVQKVLAVRSNSGTALPALTALRSAAIVEGKRECGWPLLVEADGGDAAAALCRYADVVVLSSSDPEDLLALVTLRLNLYTDPQKPVMMEPGLYAVGSAGCDSPVIVTTNFSLTYYSVRPEVESSRVPCWILLTDSEGQSVLTAWAADRFNAEVIGQSLAECGAGEKLAHREIIIPGLVAMISGEVEEATHWRVRVGPREASGIPRYLRQLKGSRR
jgi:acetyl-CoA decarbonylase/synthase complex subunit gamma